MKPSGPVARKGDYRFEVIPMSPTVRSPLATQARELLRREHYAKGGSNTAVLLLGMLRKDTNELVGVAQWLPSTKPAAEYVAKRCTSVSWRDVLSLSRLVVDASEPKNAATMLIGASVRELRRGKRWKALLTYADEGQGHTGTIYRASNWVECGFAAPRERWVDPKTGAQVSRKSTVDRTVKQMEHAGYVRAGATRKRRFIFPLRGSCTCAAAPGLLE